MSDPIEYNLSCIAAMMPDRRERIATAAMAALLSKSLPNDTLQIAEFAAIAADALIAELDKEVQP